MAVRKFANYDFRGQSAGSIKTSPSGAGTINVIGVSNATDVDVYTFPGQPLPLMFSQLGAQGASIQVGNTANGLILPVAVGASLGCAIETANVSSPSSPACFTVGTDPAFYAQATFQLATGANNRIVGVGFHTATTLDATVGDWTVANLVAANATPYADFAFAGFEATAAHSTMKTNSGAGTDTPTGGAILGNGVNVTMRVMVSATRVVTTTQNGGTLTTFGTLTNAIVVSPFFVYIGDAATGTTCNIQNFQWGWQ